MAARTIRTGVGTYLGADGVWRHGMFGEVVEVAEGDLERFDRLNPARPEVADADGEQVVGEPADGEVVTDENAAVVEVDGVEVVGEIPTETVIEPEPEAEAPKPGRRTTK